MHLFQEIKTLRQEGKLHTKLITRVRMLFVISLIILGVVAFNIIFRDAHPLLAAAFAGIGFILGFYVFSRMNVITWDEEKEIVQAGRMDILGYGTIALYIAFEIGFRTFLKDFFPIETTAYLLAGIFGTIFGRAVGMIVEIHNVFRTNHS